MPSMTDYTLAISHYKDIEELEAISGVFWFKMGAVISSEYNEYPERKWYDHERKMREISEQFPHVTFMLGGTGDGTGDETEVWDKLFVGGLMQKREYKLVAQDWSSFS